MKNWYILVLICLSLSCTSKKNAVYFETIPNELVGDEHRFDLDNKVYPINREILFENTIEKDDIVLDIELRYVRMTIQGTTKPFSNFDPDYSQTVYKFDYLDENKKLISSERTGLVENDVNIWFHPPRSNDLDVLQLSAFPYIKLNTSKNWTWELEAGYAMYQDLNLIHSYKKQKPRMHELKMGQLSCVLIEATTKSQKTRTTNSEFLYHDELGFVKLKFFTVEDTVITLEMIHGG